MKPKLIYMACTVELINRTNPQRAEKLVSYGFAKTIQDDNGKFIPYLCFK